jgi:HlyD family secretion protein/adhesin transport system membrane fusion protein|tara:strand:+ start:375548 stop:376825 length:1278 start_codon:yes stop_codon:yes gene_type:complete
MSVFDMHKSGSWNYRPVFFLAMLSFILCLVWASQSEIDQYVRGQGRVITPGKNKNIQHLEGGILADILVHEGQDVKKGDVLFVVSNITAESELKESRVHIDALQLRLARLAAELKMEDTVNFPKEIADKVPSLVINELALFQSRLDRRQEQIQGLEEKSNQKRLRLVELKTQFQDLSKELHITQEQFRINQRLLKSGAISETRYLDSKSKVSNFNTRLSSVRKKIPIIDAELSEFEANIQEALSKHESEVLDEISTVKVEIQQLQERMKLYLDKVQRTAILAPDDGEIVTVYYNTIGGTIRSGDVIAELAPANKELIVEAKISTSDRGKLWVGLPANIKITAYDYSIYGSVEGRVEAISADSLVDENGRNYYRVRISLKEQQLRVDMPIRAGMQTEVNVLTGKKKVMDIILNPLKRSFDTALGAT